jgi:hypothetical protein
MSSGIEFDEDQFNKRQSSVAGPTGQPQSAAEARGLAGWLMRRGWVKTYQGAQVFMIVLMCVNIAMTMYVITYFL